MPLVAVRALGAAAVLMAAVAGCGGEPASTASADSPQATTVADPVEGDGGLAIMRDLRSRHPMTSDWTETVTEPPDWLAAANAKVRDSEKTAESLKAAVGLFPNTLAIDFDGAVYWRGVATDINTLADELRRFGSAGRQDAIMIDWHRLATRGHVYDVVWLMNDRGIVPERMRLPPPAPSSR